MSSGDELSGSINVTLTPGYSWESIGSTGTLYSGLIDGAEIAAGSWTITGVVSTVSEPPIIALFAAGLFSIGFARRRKSAV
jgi:hypothetical protein